ncbi:MAG: peptidylprolyl isomerase, partial [Tannerella sp.]|nr:peptidylprolyl isomerase [Tannerella sp.]
MKKYGIYLMMTVTLFAATSCGDDDVDHLNDWMIANQQAFNAIRTNPEYREIKSPGNEGSIYYKVLQKGEGTDSIYYTSWISCYYEGRFVADYPRENILNGDIFERRLYEDGIP